MSVRNRNMLMGLLLTVVLLTGVMAVGKGFARFQAEQTQPLVFTPAGPGQVYLGSMATADEAQGPIFDAQKVNQWETVDGKLCLPFTVANGSSGESAAPQDQSITVRLVGSLGLGDPPPQAELCVLESGGQRIYPATANKIAEGTPLYQTYGEGWVYTFLNEAGEECTWQLPGGKFSGLDMTLTLHHGELTELSLLQPVIQAY